MGVKVNVPYHLLQFVDNHEIVEVEGKTVKQCLLNLASKYPPMMPEIFDISGELAVIVLHGEAPIDDAAIDSPVEDGDTLGLFPIIIGG